METLSSIQQVPAQPVKKPDHPQFGGQKSEYEINKQQEIQKSVSARMEFTTKLEQDDMEGVDENEWQE
uniref:LD08951p n=2 Tax=melanogaster subgroup TaxID=32351 RepID=Q8SZI2_DROME|nr:LD08951p [Drosophila melanogaster]